MAGSVNKVILVGNLGADPDVRTMQSGDEVVNLSIATSESWKDRTSGERKEKTELSLRHSEKKDISYQSSLMAFRQSNGRNYSD